MLLGEVDKEQHTEFIYSLIVINYYYEWMKNNTLDFVSLFIP